MTTTICHWIKHIKILRIYKTPVRIVQKTRLNKTVLGLMPLGIAVAKCLENAPIESLKHENLTHEQCIKQACLLTVNSASTLLTTTSSALLDICKTYRDSLNKILFLLEAVQLNGGDNPDLWDAIVEARIHVNKAKTSYNELISYMESVEKVVNSTTEAAFLAGSEYMCTALCERLYSAQKEISSQVEELKKLEEDYLKLQRDIAYTDKNNKKIKNKEVKEIKSKDNFLGI